MWRQKEKKYLQPIFHPSVTQKYIHLSLRVPAGEFQKQCFCQFFFFFLDLCVWLPIISICSIWLKTKWIFSVVEQFLIVKVLIFMSAALQLAQTSAPLWCKKDCITLKGRDPMCILLEGFQLHRTEVFWSSVHRGGNREQHWLNPPESWLEI